MPIRKSSVVRTPSGTTADRPANPSIGDTFFNGTLGVQEIYTSSGWFSVNSGNDFGIILTGSETIAILDKEYSTGSYTISSSLNDSSLDVYLFDSANSLVGYTNTPSINATNNFAKIIVYGGTNGDVLSFEYKTSYSTSSTSTDIFAAPYITSVSIADLPNINDTTTITGGNFDNDVQVWFDGANSYSQQAKSVVYGSSTSMVATRPDNLVQDNAPYTIRVVNPGITSPTGSNKHKLINAITAGSDPIWVTASGALSSATGGQSYSATVQATDPDGGAITYAVVTGQLPSGLSLNSSTGTISGTVSGGSQTFIIAATDPGGNTTNRSFSIVVAIGSGGTIVDSGGYRYHTFTSSGTYTSLVPSTADILIISGGGGGGDDWAGGGGAGGVLLYNNQSLLAQAYTVTVGAGGAGATSPSQQGADGVASSFGATLATIGGGGGGGDSFATGDQGRNGGSGGGGAIDGPGGTGTPGQGNDGAAGNRGNSLAGGGGGGAGQAGQGVNGGNGSSAYSSWGIATNTGQLVSDVRWYAGGGGGARNGTAGVGGLGGGGNGANAGTGGTAGQANTGGGGGGDNSIGEAGGSGLVIVRYPI